MKKTAILLGIIALIVCIFVGVYIYFDSHGSSENLAQGNEINETQEQPSAKRQSVNESNEANESSNESNSQNIINEINNMSIPNNTVSPRQTVETEIASFSTNLQGDSARLNNISITCNTLNGTTINSGDTFSFNSIVGQPTAAKGYQEADVIVDKKVEKGYGGGNCQVSTTIYNAALEVEGIEILERNPHKKRVTYVEEDKDAAVSYSGRFRFKI